jgi:hypothetical protein
MSEKDVKTQVLEDLLQFLEDKITEKLKKPGKEEELPTEMRSEELINLIGKLNVTQGGKITWVPYPKTIFDYVE